MKTAFAFTLLALLLSTTSPAQAGTDRKMISGVACSAERDADRAKLRYMARGLAATADVTVVCPLLRDSTLSGLKSLRVNLQRGLAQTPFGQSPPGGSMPIRARLYSCSSHDHVSAANEATACPSVAAQSDPSRLTEDLEFNNPTLPMGDGQVFVLKVTLFRDTVLKSLIYTERE